MSDKRTLTVHVRVNQEERSVIDRVATQLKRSRSDALRVLVLEKAEELGISAQKGAANKFIGAQHDNA